MKKIKFLLGALLFMATAFTVLSAQEPIKTYLSEDFSAALNPSVWNVDASTKISEKAGILIHLKDEKGTNLGGWVYDPDEKVIQGGYSDTLDGMYELMSNPIQLEEGAINIITIPYRWSATHMTPLKTFGIRIREENNSQWDTLKVHDLKSKTEETTLNAILDSQWDGKNVEIEIFFSTKYRQSSYYAFLMKEIKFTAYPDEPAVKTELFATPAPVAYENDDFNLPISITNTNAAPVSSIDYTYMIDSNVQTEPVHVDFNTELESFSGMDAGWLPVGLKDIGTGSHVFKMYPTKINGKEVEATDTVELSFLTPDKTLLTQQYVSLFEGFTSSTCPPCATANSYFNPVLARLQSAGAINVIKYQMNFPGAGDPYYISDNQTRMRFYDGLFGWGGYWVVPTPIFNGMENIMEWNAEYWSDITDQLETRATDSHKKKAAIAIDITKANIDDSHKIDLEVEITPSLDIKGRIFAVIVEKTTTGNRGSNGETEFHNVAMKFATSASGLEKSFESGKKETLSYTVDMNNTKAERFYDLEVVCFVQDPVSGYILQSSSILKSGNLPNESEEVMGDVRVYPNPASEFVNITNLDGADVEIFDLTGRRVYANSKVEGNLEIALASFVNGTYVVRLTKDGQSAHRKLIVVR